MNNYFFSVSSEEGGYTLNLSLLTHRQPELSLRGPLDHCDGPNCHLFGAWDFYIAMTAALEMKSRKKAGFLSAIILTRTTWIVKKIHFTSYIVVSKVTHKKGIKYFILHVCHSKWQYKHLSSSFTAESPTCPELNAPREKQE